MLDKFTRGIQLPMDGIFFLCFLTQFPIKKLQSIKEDF